LLDPLDPDALGLDPPEELTLDPDALGLDPPEEKDEFCLEYEEFTL